MKSRGWRAVGILLVIVAILLIGAALVVPRLIDLNRYNDFLVAQLENLTGGRVSLGPLTWGITNDIWLQVDGLSVEGATLFPGDLKLSRIDARVSLLPLLSKRVVVDELLLEGPFVTIRLVPTPGEKEEVKGDPEDASLVPPNGTAESLLPVEICIEKLEVRKGRVRLEDSMTYPGRQIVQDFTDVWIEGTHLEPGREMPFRLTFQDTSRPGLGSLKGEVVFRGLTEAFTIEDPNLEVKATLSGLDVDMVDPYLKDESLSERLGGSISLEVDYEGDFGRHFRVAGNVDLTELTYDDPSLWEQPLPGMQTTLSCEVTFDPEEVRIQEMQVNLGNAVVTLEGLLQDWREDPTIKDAVLTSELPLAELIPCVPWKKLGEKGDAIRRSMAGGGKVTVERATLPEWLLTQVLDEWRPFLAGVEGSIEVFDLHTRISPLLPGLDHIRGQFHLEKGVLRAENMTARMGPLTLPPLDLSATDLLGKPKLSAVSKGLMRLEANHGDQVKKLLAEYGLKGLSGHADFDMLLDYDHAKPDGWKARVDLVIADVRADTDFADVSFSDLRGLVQMRREKSLVVAVENLSGRMNESPIHVDGKLTGVGTRRTVLDAKVRTKGVDIALARALYPPFEDLELGGDLDLDVGVHYPYSDPMATRLTGRVTIRDLGLHSDAPSTQVEDGDADIEFSGDTLNLERMTLRANDQNLTLSGQVADIRNPRVQLRAASPNLDVDRLLAPLLDSQSSQESVEKKDEKGNKPELPALLRRTTARLQADVTRGEYRGQGFHDLTLKADYERGVLKSHSFDAGIGDGHVATRGSADLRNLEHVTFAVEPSIRAVPLETVAALVGYDQLSARGPVTLTCVLQGKTGTTEDLLRSLEGNLEGEAGPGKILHAGTGGNVLFKMLDLLDFSDIVASKSVTDLEMDGMPYDSLHAKASFKDGQLNVNALSLKSPSLGVESSAVLDLVNRQVEGSAQLTVLGAVDKGLGYVPLVGDATASIMKLYMDIQGPLANPNIVPRPGKKAKDAAGQVIRAPGEAVKKVFKGVGKGLDKMF